MQSPLLAKAMQPVMRYMMNTLMKITEDHSNDITYAEVQTFMVPEMVGKEFKDKPGTFSKTMEPPCRRRAWQCAVSGSCSWIAPG